MPQKKKLHACSSPKTSSSSPPSLSESKRKEKIGVLDLGLYWDHRALSFHSPTTPPSHDFMRYPLSPSCIKPPPLDCSEPTTTLRPPPSASDHFPRSRTSDRRPLRRDPSPSRDPRAPSSPDRGPGCQRVGVPIGGPRSAPEHGSGAPLP